MSHNNLFLNQNTVRLDN